MLLERIAQGELLEAADGGASLCAGGFNPFGIQPLSQACVDDAGHIVVTDLDSANGIELQSTPPRWLTPGHPTTIPDGSTILLGDVECTIEKAQ